MPNCTPVNFHTSVDIQVLPQNQGNERNNNLNFFTDVARMAILIIFPLKLGLGSLNCRLVDKRDAVLEPLNKKGLLIKRFLLGLVFDDKVEDGAGGSEPPPL